MGGGGKTRQFRTKDASEKEPLLVPTNWESPFGLAVRRYAGSIPFQLSFLFKCCGLWTL